MRPFGTCGFAWLASLLATSCTHGGHPAALAPKDVTVDTVMVFTADSGSTGQFPQIPDSSRLLADGSIRPDSSAGPCEQGSEISTQQWPRTGVPLHPGAAGSLTIHLPSSFTPQFFGAAQMVTWYGPPPTNPRSFPAHISLWFGQRERGYPMISIGGKAHQTQLHECRLRLADDHAIAVMLFAVAWSEPPMLAEHYLLATGELNPTLRIEVIATGDDSAAQSQFLAALRSIEVPRR